MSAAHPIRVLIVDDEPLARAGVRALLGGDPEMAVVGECGDGAAAVRDIAALAPDLVFLDVQMPERDGFAVLRDVGASRMPAVVFVTAYDQFAVRAFEVHALDYLLKPFDDERFALAVARAKAALRRSRTDELSRRLVLLLEDAGAHATTEPRIPAPAPHASRDEPLTRVVVKSAGRVVFIRVEDIDWIEAADYYARLHVRGKSYLLRETMAVLGPGSTPRASSAPIARRS